MGFFTGLIGGATLTTLVIHLSLQIHARNRLHQSQLLHQQSLILDSVSNPKPIATSTHVSRTYAADREVREQGALERLKERWNRELEDNMKKVYGTDWSDVRENVENSVAGLWGRAFEGTREGVVKAEEAVKGR